MSWNKDDFRLSSNDSKIHECLEKNISITDRGKNKILKFLLVYNTTD